jgi:tRNA pseudouridine32 synthase / 23S rRNA pseudouridine746 synthase
MPSQPTPSRQAEEAADRAKDVGSNSPHLTWLALEPMTGRTHQLRVHCAAMGWPIVGDSIYGSAARTDAPGLHLLAREIVVPLYKNRAPIRTTAPVPSHMRQLLHACGWSGDALAE